MFSRKKQPPIKSLIATGCRLDGRVEFSEGLRVDGQVTGDVCALSGATLPSLVVISETGAIEGRIEADHVIINGKVTGPVKATELLELQPKARIVGDVTYKALEMHQGATISGQMHPLDAEKPMLALTSNPPAPQLDAPVK